MNPIGAFFAGIAPEHALALAVALVLPMFITLIRGRGTPIDQWAAVLLAVSAAVHLALLLAHRDSPLLTVGFLGSGVAYAWLALRARAGLRWRAMTAVLVPATLVAYLAVVAAGEEPDQVGIVTALVELAAFGLAVVPPGETGRRRRFARAAGSTATVLATVIVGASLWIGSFRAHQAAHAADPALVSGTGHSHGHEHAARAQAGVIMRPLGDNHHPTAAQQRAAVELTAATKASTARYGVLAAALAAGYRLPLVRAQGMDVHLENPAFKKDGRVLDPQRPEMLVYAIEDDRATLLGVVYVMEVAGRPGPAPGGPVTRWHAHNLCLSVVPPGIGIVSPYGACPAFSVNVTSTEMMHVWVVDNPPAGPFADGLDNAWVRAYHAKHGVPTKGG